MFFRIDFLSAANKRFLKRNRYGSFVMHNYCGIRAFDSRHVRRNSITFVAARFFQTKYALLHDILGRLFTKRYHICGNEKQRDHYQRQSYFRN